MRPRLWYAVNDTEWDLKGDGVSWRHQSRYTQEIAGHTVVQRFDVVKRGCSVGSAVGCRLVNKREFQVGAASFCDCASANKISDPRQTPWAVFGISVTGLKLKPMWLYKVPKSLPNFIAPTFRETKGPNAAKPTPEPSSPYFF
jgi:hypothetical protein